ncbi:hypothetical protein [Facklamia miroungae]|uniref:Uncharacterized protein n=1 Tax=Facklamia miroungae TaxID=120956 RepID=A0A1G7T012_9LACT|nr:hypothetical protein [Facklamia miroungae]NKZ29472.1 hypothetical protein [Facklamia miroungae]SDG28472.1 hypothetical protein SAMN05421791_104225 [Facklamia miroungae]
MNKKTEQQTIYLRAAMILYLIVVCLQFVFISGIFSSFSLTQIFIQEPHLLLPAKVTFYLWPLIILWETIGLIIGQSKHDDSSFKTSYQILVAPKIVELNFFHIIYLLVWSQKIYLFAFIIMMLYLRRMISLMKLISYKSSLNKSKWLLKLPIGLHTGWLISMSVYIFYTYIVSKGLNSQNIGMLFIASILLIAISAGGAYLYARYGNQTILLSICIFLIGLLYNHAPRSSFALRNDAFYLVIAVIFILCLAVYIRYIRYQMRQKKSKLS